MTSRIVTAAAAVALATSVQALDIEASAGGSYVQSNLRTPDTSERIPSWSWLANGSLSATPFRPGLLRIDADGQYDSTRTLYSQGTSTGAGLGYHLSTSAFGDLGAPVSAFAYRQRTDFTADVAAQQTGTSITNAYGGSAGVGGGDLPSVRGQFTRTERDNQSFGQSQRGISDQLSLLANQRLANTVQYDLSYDTSWNTGSIANTNYRQHQFGMGGNAQLAPALELLVSDHYFLRSPTVSAATNPRYEQNDVSGGLALGRGTETYGTLTYANTHRVVQTLDAPTEQQTTHGVTAALNHRLTPDLTLTGSGSGNYVLENAGDLKQRSTGEQVSPGFIWTRDLAKGWRLQTSGTVTFALLQVAGDAVAGARSDIGHGEDGSITLLMDRGGWNGRLGYQGSYGDNLGGAPGTAFAHRVTAAGSGAPWRGAALTTELRLASSRRDSPLLGTAMSRELSGTAQLAWRRFRYELNAGSTDGLTGPLAAPGFSDGLILSPGYNTHSKFANLTLTHQLSRTFSWSVIGRYLDALAPGQPRSYEAGGSLLLGWNVGKFTLQAEDRFADGGSGGSWTRANLLYVRVLRRFDLQL